MNSTLGRAKRVDVLCWLLRICLILLAIAIKSCCFCQPDGIIITLLEEDIFCKENFICSLLFARKVHEKYVYQKKRSFLSLLLLMCGDVENIQDPQNQTTRFVQPKGIRFNQKVFHQNIQSLFHEIAKLSTFLHTHKNTYFVSHVIVHIDNSTPTQLFEIPGYTIINRNWDVGTLGGVVVYIKDGIPFIRRTELEVNELECIWLERNTKSFLISVWYRSPSTSEFLPTNFNELLRNSLIKVLSENKEMILTGDFNINYQKVDDNGKLKSLFTLFQLK